MMPELRTVRIGALGRVVTGKTPPSARPELFGHEYPFLTPSDMDGATRYAQSERFLSLEGYNYQRRLLLPPRSICVVCIGATIGKVCMTSEASFTNQQVNSIVPNEDEHDPYFVYHLLRTLRDELKSNAGGAATPIINKSAFSDIRVSVPALPLQRRVAGILAAYDELIENNTRRIAILEEMTRRAFHERFIRLIGSLPMPGNLEGAAKLPKGWTMSALEDRALITMGQSPPSSEYTEEGTGLPFHQGVTDFVGFFHDNRLYCSNTDKRRIAEEGDILFSVRAPVARLAIALNRMVLGRGLASIRPSDRERTFIWTYLRTLFPKVDMFGSGTIYNAVNKDDVHGIPVICPPQADIESFESFASPAWRLIKNLHCASERLSAARDLLLPRLLSGEIEVLGDQVSGLAAA